jgi:DNA-binding CsgD family transcriptional regulator
MSEETPHRSFSDKTIRKINRKIKAIEATADEIPGVIIIHNIHDGSVVYMSKRGLDILGVTLKEVIDMGTDYHTNYFNAEEAKEYVPKLLSHLERNNHNEILSLFQQVRPSPIEPFTWYLTSMKIFMRDEDDRPILTIGIALPIDPKHHLTSKVSRLLEENNFLRNNIKKFTTLGNREKEVLKLLALGKSSSEIAKELFISVATVETHRKNIRCKLEVSTSYQLAQYARAFDLI